MSPIGRIFIVLNLALAVLFLGWSSNHLATAQNYLGDLEAANAKYDTDIADKNEEIEQLRVSVTQRDSSLSTIRQDRDSLQAERDRLSGELDDQKQKNSALAGDLAKISNTLNDFNETISAYSDKNASLNQQIRDAEQAKRDAEEGREDALAAQRDSEAESRRQADQIAGLEIQRTTLQKQVSDLDTQLSMLAERTNTTLGELVAMKAIDGAVLQVTHDITPGLVSINKGSNDGVKRGYTFDIYRGAKYKGQVRVENVQPNMCTCVIIKTYEGRTIEQGDSAATRI